MRQAKNDQKADSVKPASRLGRGLSALIPTATEPVAPRQPAAASESKAPSNARATQDEPVLGLTMVPLTRIALNPFQPRDRFEPMQLEELTESIRQHGVLQPIVVRPKANGNYELVAGERRFRAATAAGLSQLPAVVRELTDRESLALALIENLQREDLNPVESARAYKRLIDEFGLTQAELALEVGKSQSSIANSLRLLGLSDEILFSVAEGQITEGHAKAILSVGDEPKQLMLRREIIDQGLSVRQAERRATALKRDRFIPRGIKDADAPAATDLDIRAIESELSTVLGTGVRFKFLTQHRGRIEIDFYDTEQLEGVLQRLIDIKPSGI